MMQITLREEPSRGNEIDQANSVLVRRATFSYFRHLLDWFEMTSVALKCVIIVALDQLAFQEAKN